MAIINPAAYFQNRVDHTAQNDRLALQALLASTTSSFGSVGGVRYTNGTDLKVTQDTGSNMQVQVAAGQAMVPGTENTFQGTYSVANDAAVTLAIAASNATNPRIDIVVAQVLDQFYSGGSNLAQLAVVTGTPAASPAAPAAPSNSITLGQVLVPALSTAVVNANITDTRVCLTAHGRAPKFTSTSRPPHSAGLMIYETDTTRLMASDGTTWQRAAYLGTGGRIGCRLGRVANQSINSASTTAISWDTEYFDSDGLITTPATTVTIPANGSGNYAMSLYCQAGVTGVRNFAEINFTSTLSGVPGEFRTFMTTSEGRVLVTGSTPLNAGDTFVCNVFHNSGGPINFTAYLNLNMTGR